MPTSFPFANAIAKEMKDEINDLCKHFMITSLANTANPRV